MPGPGSRQTYPRGRRGFLKGLKKIGSKRRPRPRRSDPLSPGAPRVAGTPGGSGGGGGYGPNPPWGGSKGGVARKQAGGFVHRRNQRRQG